MIDILIAEDDGNKQLIIKTYIKECFGDAVMIDTSLSSVSTKKALRDKCYDILILDMCLPVRDLTKPISDEGIRLLHEIRNNSTLNNPSEIIGLTAYGNLEQKYTAEFKKLLLTLLTYTTNGHGRVWKDPLRNRIAMLLESKTTRHPSVSAWIRIKKKYSFVSKAVSFFTSLLKMISFFKKGP